MTDVVDPLEGVEATVWPPVIPANTRTNSTAQVDTHPADHNAIADALTSIVAQVNPSAWVALPFAANWGNFGSGYQTCQYRKVGDVVEVRGVATRSAAATPPQTIATFPTGFRPPAKVILPGQQGANLYELTVNPDGTFQLTGAAGSVSIVSFPGTFRFAVSLPA